MTIENTNLLDSAIEASPKSGNKILKSSNEISTGITSEQIDNLDASTLGDNPALAGMIRGMLNIWDAAEYGITLDQIAKRFQAETTVEGKAKLYEEMQTMAYNRANLATDSKGNLQIMTAGEKANEANWHDGGTQYRDLATFEDVKAAMELSRFEHRETIIPEIHAIIKIAPDGSEYIVPGHFAKTSTIDGLVQPEDALKWMYEAIEGAGGKFASAGFLGDGTRFFATFDCGEFEVLPGDSLNEVGVWSMDFVPGREATKIFGTCDRPVCENTLRQAWVGGKPYLTLRKTANYSKRFQQAVVEIRRHIEAQTDRAEAFREMAKFKVDPTVYFNQVLDQCTEIEGSGVHLTHEEMGKNPLIYALEQTAQKYTGKKANSEAAMKFKKAAQNEFEVSKQQRSSILDLLINRYESETNSAPGTVWGALNAFTEHTNYSGAMFLGEADKSRYERYDSLALGHAGQMNDAAQQVAIELIA